MTVRDCLRAANFTLSDDGDHVSYQLSHRVRLSLSGFRPIMTKLETTPAVDPARFVRGLIAAARASAEPAFSARLRYLDGSLARDPRSRIEITLRVGNVRWWEEPPERGS